jgi:glycosyltransferase involved in cell wall biosynthesis
MQIVAITRVLDEADIIECFVRHTARFVGHHIFMDNGSTDGTIDILAALQREGVPLTVYQSKSISFPESDALTELYHRATEAHSPDCVLSVDADEFIDDRQLTGGLHHYLQQVSDSAIDPHYVSIPMVNYAATAQDDPREMITPVRLRKRLPPADAFKIIIRGNLIDQGLRIAHGSHRASLEGKTALELREPRLWLAHYSERSPYQYILKFVRGWSKVLASGRAEVEAQTAYHYRAPYEYLRDRPQDLLRNPHFMGFKNDTPELIDDPIDYRGGPLKYTAHNDEAMRAVRCLMGFLYDLSQRHGEILDQFPEVRRIIRDWEAVSKKIL